MEIRELRPDEYEAAGRITADAYREFVDPGFENDWVEYLAEIADVAGRAPRMPVLAALEDGRILGTATIEHGEQTVGDDDERLPEDTACLRMLGVDPSVRRGGVGRALVEAALDWARSHGMRTMILRTTTRMTTAHRLYESLGFERAPELDMEFPEVSLIAYRLALRAHDADEARARLSPRPASA